MSRGQPGRKCSICLHVARPAIDAALLSGQKHADLARQYALSSDAISRHARRHVSAHAADQAPASVGADAASVDVIASVGELQQRVMRLLRQAETKRDVRGALAAVREAAGLLTLLGKLQGIISADGTRVAIQVNGPGPNSDAAVRARVLAKLAALSGGRTPPLLIDGTAE